MTTPTATPDRLRRLLGIDRLPQVLRARIVGAAEAGGSSIARSPGPPAGVPGPSAALVRPAAGSGPPAGPADSPGPVGPSGASAAAVEEVAIELDTEAAADAPAPLSVASIPAFLLRPAPERANGAGVVLVAGHGRGIDDLMRTDPADEYHGALALRVAAAGFTVLCPEMTSFGRRRTPPMPWREPYALGESSCGVDAANFLLHGVPVLGRRVADAGAAAAALGALPGVDPGRVAVVGGSGGGAVSLLLAATDTSIAAALVANYFSSYAASIASIRHCPCNIVPGLLADPDGKGALEMRDIAARIAPRPLIIETGEQDPIFPVAAARSAFSTLPARWQELGAPAPHLVVTETGHRFVAERSLELLVEAMT